MGGSALSDKIALLPVILPVLIMSLTLHELAHGFIAFKLGDRTAKDQGRLTLNPIKHLDPFGSGLFLFTFLFTSFPFGWARPVPVHFRNLKDPKRDFAIVALGGPVTNFLIALGLVEFIVHGNLQLAAGSYLARSIETAIAINVVLSVFNLIPIPPLDGSRIIGAFMPNRMYEDWLKVDQYAPLIFLTLFFMVGNAFQTLLGRGINQAYSLLLWIVGA